MKALFALALLLSSTFAHAASPWEILTEKVMQEGVRLESNFGATKYLERRVGNQVIYLTIELNNETGQAKRYSAVIEEWEQTPGNSVMTQNLFWFTPVGELAVVARYRFALRENQTIESRQEIVYGVEPEASDLALWDAVLNEWVSSL